MRCTRGASRCLDADSVLASPRCRNRAHVRAVARRVRRAAAARGNLIPVYRELLADGDTPVSAYAALGAASTRSCSSRSSAARRGRRTRSSASRRARSCAGRRGTATVTWYDVDGGGPPRTRAWPTPDPTPRSPRCSASWRPVDVPGLPRFWGGAVGWIALRLRARVRGSAGARGPTSSTLPPLCMVVTDTLLIFDNLRQTLKVVATPYVARPERAEARVRPRVRADRRDRRDAARAAPPLPPLEPPRPASAPVDAPPSSFTHARDTAPRSMRVKEYILAGDAFQVVLSQRFAEPRGRRAPARRLSRAARDQSVAVHVPPRVPRGARHRRVARDARAARRDGASRCARSPARGRAARRPPRTSGSPPSCSPIRRSAPST